MVDFIEEKKYLEISVFNELTRFHILLKDEYLKLHFSFLRKRDSGGLFSGTHQASLLLLLILFKTRLNHTFRLKGCFQYVCVNQSATTTNNTRNIIL